MFIEKPISIKPKPGSIVIFPCVYFTKNLATKKSKRTSINPPSDQSSPSILVPSRILYHRLVDL